MKKQALWIMIWGLVTILLAAPVSAEEVTIVGRVTDAQKIVTDAGVVYEVALTDLGDELLLDHEGERVEVYGTVETVDDLRIITVLDYTLHEE